ncbi:MAG TPA: metalloregulator ArsR/SmtB family transcription factor [Clostridia bacterium]
MHNCQEVKQIKIPFSDQTVDVMAGFLKALSDPTRLKIMLLLSISDGLNVCDIANNLEMTHSAVSHQLGMLKRMRLLYSKKQGKNVAYFLADDHIYSIINSASDHAQEIVN